MEGRGAGHEINGFEPADSAEQPPFSPEHSAAAGERWVGREERSAEATNGNAPMSDALPEPAARLAEGPTETNHHEPAEPAVESNPDLGAVLRAQTSIEGVFERNTNE